MDDTMNKYRVTINGTSYEIEVEQISGEASAERQAASTPAPAAPKVSGEGEQIVAPLPGSIFSINVTNGQSIKKGQVLMVLEAMKMENEIMAPFDGTVGAIAVKVGDAVDSGALLCTLIK